MFISDICAEIRNYFLRNRDFDIHTGKFKIINGSIESLPFLADGQYYRIVGSVFNDGVHVYGENADELQDETFSGSVWAMAVPPDVIALAAEIEDWNAKNADRINGPFQSESFGGYSYSLKSGQSGANNGGTYGWKDQFASRLNPYRRISVL